MQNCARAVKDIDSDCSYLIKSIQCRVQKSSKRMVSSPVIYAIDPTTSLALFKLMHTASTAFAYPYANVQDARKKRRER